MLIGLVKTVLPLMCLDVGLYGKIEMSHPVQTLLFMITLRFVRGATGLTQSNSEPGGTINLSVSGPTALFKHTGEMGTDPRQQAFGFGWSGSLNNEHTVRGRLVGVHEDHRSFKEGVWNKRKDMVYGVIDTDLSDNIVC